MMSKCSNRIDNGSIYILPGWQVGHWGFAGMGCPSSRQLPMSRANLDDTRYRDMIIADNFYPEYCSIPNPLKPEKSPGETRVGRGSKGIKFMRSIHLQFVRIFPTRRKFMQKKEYPPFFEKAIPIALVIIGILMVVLLVITLFVLFRA